MSGAGRRVEQGVEAPRTEPVGACPVCLEPGGRERFRLPDRMHATPGRFAYRRCDRCGTTYQDPRVVTEDLPLLYPPVYYTHAGGSPVVGSVAAELRPTVTHRDRGGWRERLRRGVRDAVAPGAGGGPRPGPLTRLLSRSRWLRERAFHDRVPDELLPRTWPPGRALDVGCGSGRLMRQLAAVGWEVEGAEPDPAAAEAARAATGCVVHAFGATELAPSLGPFRLIVLSHVVEHLPDPGAALRVLAGLLAAGGRIVLLYPNPASLGARRFGAHWFHWDAPRHLVIPPPRALPALAGRVGLVVRRMRTRPRWGPETHAHSRGYLAGRPCAPGVTPSWTDRALAWAEGLLVGVGLTVGEEVVVVLGREGA